MFPGIIAAQQSFGLPDNNPTGLPSGDFALTIGDPPSCTVGFLPPSQWRSPEDQTTVDTPDGLYCKLPQDSPISVRGARNYPCIEHPGKRAPTVELLQRSTRIRAAGLAPTHARPVSLRPEPDHSRVSRPMIGWTSRSGSTRRSRALRCHRRCAVRNAARRTAATAARSRCTRTRRLCAGADPDPGSAAAPTRQFTQRDTDSAGSARRRCRACRAECIRRQRFWGPVGRGDEL